MPQLKYWLAFSSFYKIGPQRFKKIIDHFPSLEVAFQSNFSEFRKAGLEEKIIEEFLAFRRTINLEKEWERLKKENIKIVTLEDKNYPSLLKEIYNPPPLLYYKGNLKILNEFGVAVVGTRRITSYGRQVVPKIVNDLSAQGVTIISGLALGVDTLAHVSSLDAGGQTIAVLGHGLDKIYPTTNYPLAQKIVAKGGTLISEFPLGTPPLKHHFPQRNRLISGLSLGTLIVEADEKSGALITGRYSLEQNREVFAIPGNIYNNSSKGTNNLIKMGAKLVTSANDILEELNLTQVSNFISNRKIVPETKEEKILLEILSREPLHINEIVKLSGLDISRINSTLTLMEMKGKVNNLGGTYVISQ